MGTTHPQLRRARPEDAAAVHGLVAAAYGPSIPLLGRTPLPMLADQSAAIRDHEVWVLEDDGTIVGVIELIERPDHLWVENVAVAPDRQGDGLGRRLLRHAEERAAASELPELRLSTNERYVANIAMYERYGYRETHRTPYQGTDLVHFRKRR